jgi:taurine dioxygenase
MLEVTELSPVGAWVRGVQVGALDGATAGQLRDVLARHGVVILPGQHVDNTEFSRFLGSFGELTFTVGETPVPGFPDLNVISNVGRRTPPRSTFHVDTSYVRHPPAYTALRAVQIPQHGGHTLFTNQYRAWETLPDAMRADLASRSITHVVTGLDLDEDQETEAVHPIALVHPISGRTALYLSTPQRCAAVSGLSADAAAELVADLFAHSTRDDNVLRHEWRPGDVVMWDNRCVLHRADHDDVVGDRVMHRGMVADTVTV